MALLKLTASPGGYFIWVNTDLVIGFSPDPLNQGGAVLFMMTGPYWNQDSPSVPGNASISVTQSPSQVAALWPGSLAPGSIPLSALATTGTPDATKMLRGDGAWTVMNQP